MFTLSLKVGLNTEVESQKLYKNLISRLGNDSDVLMHAHESISDILSETEEYVKTWTSYQALWDLQSDQVYSRIGTDLAVSLCTWDGVSWTNFTVSRFAVWLINLSNDHSFPLNKLLQVLTPRLVQWIMNNLVTYCFLNLKSNTLSCVVIFSVWCPWGGLEPHMGLT